MTNKDTAQQGAVNGQGLRILVSDVDTQAEVLDTVHLPHVLPHLGQLVGPHLTLLKHLLQSQHILAH